MATANHLPEARGLPLEVVDGIDLPGPIRSVLRPGEALEEAGGRARRLPRYFYEVPSWQTALDLTLAPHFRLWEFLEADVREAPAQRKFPRYVPCAVTLLAAHLELFRTAVGSYVHIAANGGYRSPGHRLTRGASPHCWGTAANIYRIGSELLDTRERIERYARVARDWLPGVWLRPYGEGAGQADDHLHLDLGYVVAEPHATGDEAE